MFLSAKETQGVPIAVYDARGYRHESVLWCDTELGLIGAMYEFAPGSEREYSAPAPLRLVNMETGLEISDELDLAVASAFLRLKWKHETQWERLEDRQKRVFTGLQWQYGCPLGKPIFNLASSGLVRHGLDT